MKQIIVTTTINHPTEALRRFSDLPDWHLVVVADTKTPADGYADLDARTRYICELKIHQGRKVPFRLQGDEEQADGEQQGRSRKALPFGSEHARSMYLRSNK